MQIAEESLSEFAKTVELTGTKFLEGFHRSLRSGSGVEFHELRAYGEGEDARHIDWKRLASSDRYLVRQFEKNEKTAWRVWVDSSESMTYGQKRSWAANFAGSVLYVAQTLGDSWSLLGQEKLSLFKAYEELMRGETLSAFPKFVDLDLRRGDRLVLISDFFFDLDEMIASLEAVRDQVSQIVLVQTLDAKEMRFDFKDVIQFDDRESPSQLILDASAIKAGFLKSLADHQGRLKKALSEGDAFYVFEDQLNLIPSQLAEFFGVA
jgi:hypothetical protein